MGESTNTFRYTYSAAQQEEIKAIREKYMPPAEDRLEQLRKLDRRAVQRAQAVSIALGVIGALLLGTGMSLIMTDFAGLTLVQSMLTGVPAGLVGLILVALAYPSYTRRLKKERRRIAPEILRLSDELMK